MAPDTNGWSRAEMFVLEELKRLSGEVAANGKALNDLRVNLERKSVIWSTITSAVVSGIVGLFRR